MAGEKAKENATLKAACVACGKEMSVELLRGIVVGAGRQRHIAAVCPACLDKGWTPDSLESDSAADAPDSSEAPVES